MAIFMLGMKAVLYFGETDVTPPALSVMTPVDNVQDVTVNGETEECDITTRGNEGWAATAATLRKLSITCKVLWLPEDAFFEALQEAWLENGTVHIAALDQVYTETGAQGPKGDFTVTNFTKAENLKEAQVVDVTLSLAAFDEWFVAGGS